MDGPEERPQSANSSSSGTVSPFCVILHTDASVQLKQRPWGEFSLVISILVLCSADLESVQLLLFLSHSQWWAITGAMERNLYYDWGLFQYSIRVFPVFCISPPFSVFPTHSYATLGGRKGGKERGLGMVYRESTELWHPWVFTKGCCDLTAWSVCDFVREPISLIAEGWISLRAQAASGSFDAVTDLSNCCK